MYVKVVPLAAGDPPRVLSAKAVIHRVPTVASHHDGAIHTGRVFLTEDPHDDWVEPLGIVADAWRLEYADDGPGPTSTWSDGKPDGGGPAWDMRYAWWWTLNDFGVPVQHWVVTGGRIFILSDSGKTIDTVN